MTDIYLQRLKGDEDASIGVIVMDDFMAFSCEDEFRETKVKGETRIPAGRYQVVFNEIVTPMTVKYRSKYPWFHLHIEIIEIPGFTRVYFHIGNDDDDTAGCVLVGSGSDLPRMTISNSTEAFKEFYTRIRTKLEAGEEVWITIKDEQNFKAALAA